MSASIRFEAFDHERTSGRESWRRRPHRRWNRKRRRDSRAALVAGFAAAAEDPEIREMADILTGVSILGRHLSHGGPIAYVISKCVGMAQRAGI